MSWTKEDSGKLMEYYTAQMTVKEIAKKMGKPEQRIRDELNSRGAHRSKQSQSPRVSFSRARSR